MGPKLWLPVLSLAAVAWLVVRDLERTSPRPISATHAQASELLDPRGCELCHGARDEDMRTACGACHAAIEEELVARVGLHGTLAEVDGAECELCHIEHHGEEFPLVNEAAFRTAGFAGRAGFDHGVLDFLLKGRHTDLECVDCHRNARVALLPEGEPRFLGLDQSCDACHEDVHEGLMARACADCHGQELPFSEVATFAHRTVSLEGAHAGLACAECHAAEGPHSVAALAGATPTTLERGCADCHQSPHAPSFSDAGCASCHAAVHGAFEGHADAMPIALHAASGFALATPHAEQECAECHTGESYDGRFPGRAPGDCAACHADPHEAQFGERACVDCHDAHAFEPPAFGPIEHALTAFPLEASHAGAECHACHADPHAGRSRAFAGVDGTCSTCHADAHRGLLVGGAADDCGRCHTPTHFADVAKRRFEHDEWTRFPLRGAHERAGCVACHRRAKEADERGRRFGFASDLVRESSATRTNAASIERCASCHADPHGESFERAGDCSECHDDEFFHEGRERFDHGEWTRFALEGAHARAACESCHPRADQPDAFGRTFGRAREPLGECATCHADPHGGAFDRPALAVSVEGRAGCARCHGNESFAELVRPFEHGKWTGYPLSPEHAPLACVACHAPRAGAAAGEARLAQALGRGCADCHADPHAGQFVREGRTDCARCHADAGALAFDHERDSRFRLDRSHVGLACAACHLPWPLASGEEVVRYRPLGTECGDCHGPGFRSGGAR